MDAAWGAQLIQPAQVVQLGVKQEGLANTPLLTTLNLPLDNTSLENHVYTALLILMIFSTRIVYWLILKGTMSREFLLQIFS